MRPILLLARRAARGTLLLIAILAAWTCGLDQLTGSGSTLDVVLSTDTVIVVGATKSLVVSAVDATPLAGVHVSWSSANLFVATVDSAGVVTAIGEGSTMITATLTAPELPPGGVEASRRIVVQYAGLVMTAIDSLTGLGAAVAPVTRGTNVAGTAVQAVPATLTSSDPAVAAIVANQVVARKNGTATITASYTGLSASTAVKVRQVAKRVFFAPAAFVFKSLGRDTAAVVTVYDTRDSLIATPSLAWSTTNAAVATVTSGGVMRALQVASASIKATVDTVTATLPVSVVQSVASITKAQGDAQVQVAGQLLPAPLTVTAKDAGGYPVAGATVTFSVASGGGAITGATQVTDAQGNATVGSWTLGTTAGANALLASSGSASATFGATGTAGAATRLLVQQSPGSSQVNAVGAAIAPAIQITIRDANSNLVTTSTAAVTIALGAGTATLGGTTTVNAVAGVATFSDLTLSAPGIGFTLAASATGLTGVTTPAFNVVGPAAKLAFTVQPATATAGAGISPSIQVSVQDAAGTTITSATNSITLAVGANPGSATLSGTATQAATSGVASFAGLSLDKSGTAYTLVATATGLASATSATFNINPGTASKLVFKVQPSNTSPATVMSPAVQVAVTDALGNTVTSSSATVGIAIGTNPSSGTLGGTVSIAASAGIATFSTLQINNIGNGYTLSATSTGLTSATSSTFNIVGAGTPRALVFVTDPGATVAGVSIAPAITVKVVDSVGTTVNSSTASITLAFGTNTTGATLSGTLTASASSGVASFSTVKVNRAGSGYTLVASSSGLTSATSAAFAISAGTASALTFAVQPVSTPVGGTITPAVQVAVIDNQGNTVPSASNAITLAIGTNPGGGTLGGTASASASSGVASFANLSIGNAGTGYTLTASATGLTGVTSSAFDITTGSPKQVRFVVGPSAATAGAAIAPSITVKVVDSVGATVVSPVTAVTLVLGANPNGATLSGTLTANTSNGVATFNNVKLNRSGTGATLVATATGLAPDTSASFAINVGTASALAFAVQPTSVVAGVAIAPAVQVSITDNQGNVVTTATNTVTVAIAANPGGATLGGTAQAAAVSGVATFSNLSLNKIGTNYTLSATATGLSAATSAQFSVAGGPPTQLRFTTQPATVNVGANMSNVVVTVRDAAGNTATSASMPVTLALLNNPSAAALGGTVTVNAVSGVATFAGLQVDKAGQGYTLVASAAGPNGPLAGDTSSAFNGIGPATVLVFTTQPSGAVKNTVIAPSIVVEARDAAGNRATSYTGSVAISIQTNVNGATVSGTTARNANAGLATFNDLKLDSAGNGYSLRATASALTGATSATFDIAAFGAASKLAFKTQPGTADANASLTPAVEVEVQDASGNRVTNSSAAITFTFGANPGSATIGGTNPVSAVNGVAQFTNLSVSAVGSAYTLTASATGLAPVTSNAFNIVVPGSAVRLRFDGQPTGTTAGSQIAPAIVISAISSSGGVVTGASGLISLAVDSGPAFGGLGQATLSNGQVSFSTIALTVAGTYRLKATGAGLATGVSQYFTITHGFANKLAFTTQPQQTVAGNVLASGIDVQVQDVYGNRVQTAGNQIKVSWNGSTAAWGCLDGDTLHVAILGQATFSALRPRCTGGPGSQYYLTASASGLASANTAYFVIDPSPPSFLWFNYAPASATGRQPYGVCVTVRDSLGNYSTAGQLITLTLAANPAGGHLGGTTSGTTAYNHTGSVGGVCSQYSYGYANYINLAPTLDSLGGGYTLTASSSGLASATTGTFNIVASSATQIGFVVPPSTVKAGSAIAPAMRVCVLDAYGNEVRTATGSLALSIGVNPGGATIGGTLSRALVSGCANFNDITISAAGSGYALTVTPTNVNGVSGISYSPLFNVTP